ncbi:hypothetical protein [Pleionea mediterranea]|uniref:DUF218 domain-containing protein n=1 Tax=Pleionea mediterranea TaxID=523701 RepID=A0A316FTU0_9GAMM|nr:hypothetical protein [Pleionea mediterranea]PWK51989.1 hypothetical protein C8D97_105306 [Pleionea mediterranea]
MANTGFFTLLTESLLLPPGLNLLLGLIAWGLWKSWPKTAKSLLTFSAVSLYLMSTPLMSAWLEAMLPQSKPLTMQQIEALKNDEIPTAIVLVSAGRRKGAEEYGLTETVNAETLEILRYGAFLQRKTGFPIMVVGGTPNGESTPEAVLMNQVLTDEFGAEVNWMVTNLKNSYNFTNNSVDIATSNMRKVLISSSANNHITTNSNFKHIFISLPSKSPPTASKLSLLASPESCFHSITMLKSLLL